MARGWLSFVLQVRSPYHICSLMVEGSPSTDSGFSESTFFSETGSEKHVPRSLYIDLEPDVIDDKISFPHRDTDHGQGGC